MIKTRNQIEIQNSNMRLRTSLLEDYLVCNPMDEFSLPTLGSAVQLFFRQASQSFLPYDRPSVAAIMIGRSALVLPKS
jgi:hypothetical protein